ncbi:unnamed protein product [Discosporangium mesarthrocarpum]
MISYNNVACSSSQGRQWLHDGGVVIIRCTFLVWQSGCGNVTVDRVLGLSWNRRCPAFPLREDGTAREDYASIDDMFDFPCNHGVKPRQGTNRALARPSSPRKPLAAVPLNSPTTAESLCALTTRFTRTRGRHVSSAKWTPPQTSCTFARQESVEQRFYAHRSRARFPLSSGTPSLPT